MLMTTLESIHQYAEMLPAPLQREVLDFVMFLLSKQEQETTVEPVDTEWSNFSLASVMRGMENEDTPQNIH